MKREERRQQVLTCAAEIFAERGYHQTSISDIIARAGIARGTFYLYFQDKRSIFDELVDRLITPLNARIVRIDPSLPPSQCLVLLRENIQVLFEVIFEHRDLAKILLSDAVGLDPEFDRKLLAFYENLTSMVERSLRRGQNMKIVHPCNIQVTAILIVGSIKELMYQVTMHELNLEIPTLVESLLRHFREGVLDLPRDL